MGADRSGSPLTPEDFAARCEALRAGAHFAIAVSGGRDSMALACLSAAHVRKVAGRVLALTVDHGLRDGSGEEAKKAHAWCEALGLEHKILHWEGAKPQTGIQSKARAARYKLLITETQNAGLDCLMTGHNADDQAETVLMRLARGAGVTGLRAMEPEMLFAAGASEPIRLLRPLLEFPRARLTATVNAYGQSFSDDPSNDDPLFERVRARALLADEESPDAPTRQSLLQTAAKAQQTHDHLQRQNAEVFQRLAGCYYEWGGISLDYRLTKKLDSDVLATFARRLIYAVSGASHAPEAAAALRAFVGAFKSGSGTIGGALIRAEGGRLWVLREPAALLGRAGVAAMVAQQAPSGGEILWDNRFVIKISVQVPDAIVKPLGAMDVASDQWVSLTSAPKEAVSAIPGVFRDGELIAAPGRLSKGYAACSFTALMQERFKGGIVRFS